MINLQSFIDNTADLSPEEVIATAQGGNSIRWSDLCERIGKLRTQLQNEKAQVVAVYQPDILDFLVTIIALWQTGKTPLVLPNNLESTIEKINQFASAALGDVDIERHAFSADELQASSVDVALFMMTSGSSGEPKVLEKTYSQLDTEISMLDAEWGSEVAKSTFVNMVPHHHMFGLPFGLLWPLCSGREIWHQSITFVDQLGAVDATNLTLVASPAQLANLPSTMDWSALSSRIANVFTAGAPLSDIAKENCQIKLKTLPTEIYGCTEMGAIAYKSIDGEWWNPITGMEVSENEGQLQVKRYGKDTQWQPLDDRVELNSKSQFLLKGRTDNIVKVGGKRISLSAIEKALCADELVDAVRVVQLPEKKLRLGAVVKLTPAGNARLIDEGKLVINKRLSRFLAGKVEAVSIPKFWRFVAEIPVTMQGKTTQSLLRSLFIKPGVERPDVLEKTFSADNTICHIRCRIPYNLRYFDGHFEGRSILPGVVQVHWASQYGKELFNVAGKFQALEQIKFQQVIQPGEYVDIKLEHHADKHKISFSFTTAGKRNSSGRLVFSGEQ